MRRFMEPFHLLLTPVVARTTFAAGADGPTEVAGEPMANPWDRTFTPPVNLTGFPAASVPCGFDPSGLPIGLQIVGRWKDDVTVLAASAAFESVVPRQQHRPPAP